MCGLYEFTKERSDELFQIAHEIELRYGSGVWSPGEIRPTNLAPVLVSEGKTIRPELQSWGYKLPKSLVINARAETAAEKPMFRDGVAHHRCIIPSSGFWEWDKEKRKFFFGIPNETVLYMAGLYSVRDGSPCYCILTTAANESMREVHHRMPLVLRREQITPWLEQPESAAEIMAMVPPLLSKSSADDQLQLW